MLEIEQQVFWTAKGRDLQELVDPASHARRRALDAIDAHQYLGISTAAQHLRLDFHHRHGRTQIVRDASQHRVTQADRLGELAGRALERGVAFADRGVQSPLAP